MSASERSYGGKAMSERRAERRRRFLLAGLAVFGESGYQSSSITAVCESAGLARAQFYEHFANREDLLVAVYEMIQDDAMRAVEIAARRADGAVAAERHRAGVAAYAHSVGGDPRRAAIAFVQIVGLNERVERHRAVVRAKWARFIRSEFERMYGPGNPPAGGYDTAATAFIGALFALVHRWSADDPRPSLDSITDVLTRFLVALAPSDS
ncbi:TetR/AcrR family transcriptional regulator [Nocardia sp. NPDC057455]|uniref:TetR/AcrR family transcriptional regulator n=1 Tax=Nocardia sp. NPDC057455 TaxID=3346138 RepID=UPI00366B92EE